MQQNFNYGSSPKFGGFWIRFLAQIIDSIIISIYEVVLLLITASFAGISISGGSYDLLTIFSLLSFYLLPLQLVPFLYVLITQVQLGGTLGKKMLGLEIRRADNYNERIGFGTSLGRIFATILSSIPLGLGFIWAAFDQRKQSWHDKLAGTVVVYADSVVEEQPMPEIEEVPVEPVPIQQTLPMRGKTFAEIVFVKGLNKGKRYTLKGDRVIFGRRASDVHIPIKDPHKFVSKIQCEIVRKNNRYYIRNLSSQDTTKLNGQTVHSPQPLRTNDIISFGNYAFKILFF